MSITWYTGLGASIFTSAALLPQLIKIIRERKAEGISNLMLVSFVVGLSLWIAYGVQRGDMLIVAANVFSLSVNLAVAFLRWYYHRRES